MNNLGMYKKINMMLTVVTFLFFIQFLRICFTANEKLRQ